MQHEKTTYSVANLASIKISACQRFHQVEEKPLYTARFTTVEKFHEPGLAPVYDASGAYHIDITGKACYNKRFLQTFGFYDYRAAVQDVTGYYHIDRAGQRGYPSSYQWVGNFQEKRCVVKQDHHFFHIDWNGKRIYPEVYDYVGDFKEGIAVVYKAGQATHINYQGKRLYDKWYKKLHVFHKGIALAEDQTGWFHIDKKGEALYAQRFKMVEPFYNGHAKVETFEGIVGQIDNQGKLQHTIVTYPYDIHTFSAELASFWHTYLTNIAVELNLLQALPNTTTQLAQQLAITETNLIRLLRALWEIKLIDYDHTKQSWQLARKGQLLQDRPFLAQAAALWARVAAEKNWLKLADLLKQHTLRSFPSFKEKERSKKKKIQLYEALLGYTAWDLKTDKIAINQTKNILLFGIPSLAIAAAVTNKQTLHYYNDPKLPNALIKNAAIQPIEPRKLASYYDLAIFCRFLQHYDDAKVLAYFYKVKNADRLLVIETILTHSTPIGGLVDINILVETGGKLRTSDDWETIVVKAGFRIMEIAPLTDYLSIIDIRAA